jgi:hypothetical protein
MHEFCMHQYAIMEVIVLCGSHALFYTTWSTKNYFGDVKPCFWCPIISTPPVFGAL